MTEEEIAEAIYESERAQAAENGWPIPAPWATATVDEKATTVNGVAFVLATPAAQAEAVHGNWVSTQVADGWGYGPVKDVPLKQHPYIVDFTLLPPEQQHRIFMLQYLAKNLPYAGLIE